MWVFLSNAFISIVAHRENRDTLIARARAKGDLERAFGPTVAVRRTPDADYLYRTELSRSDVAKAVASHARNIFYPNFKGSVVEPDRLTACHEVWDVMYGFQLDRARQEARLDDCELWTGQRWTKRTWRGEFEVRVLNVQSCIDRNAEVELFYPRSGRMFTLGLPKAQRWLRGASLS